MIGLQFKIELHQSNPKIWRRIIIPYDYTFYKFHLAIQGAFGWENRHCFQFSEKGFLDNLCYAELTEESNSDPEFVTKNAKRVKVKHVFVKLNLFKYIYDFGDHWEHNIKFEEPVTEEIERPYCIQGFGACPPEDCGGLDGYASILKSLNTPSHPDQKYYTDWLGLHNGQKWDANFFSEKEANKRLCLLE